MDCSSELGLRGDGGFLPRTPDTRWRTISPFEFSIKTATSVARSTANSMATFSPTLVVVGFRVNCGAGCSAHAGPATLLPTRIPTNQRSFLMGHLPLRQACGSYQFD